MEQVRPIILTSLENMKEGLKRDKGVAGLTIFLALISLLFVIGLLVTIFTIMGGELQDQLWDLTTTNVVNETNLNVNYTTNDTVATSTANGFYLSNVTSLFNATGVTIPLANVSFTRAGVLYLTATQRANANNDTFGTYVNASYTYQWNNTNTEANVVGNTTTSLSGAVDWFDIFIVIGAMVVLILLTVIIISAIRGSGLMGGEGSAGAGGRGSNIGSA